MKVPLPHKLLGMLLVGALISPTLSVQATETDNPTIITLEKPVHFLGTDGSDALAEPGEYSVEAAEEWLKLIPGHARQNALLVESSKGTHDEDIPEPVALSVPGEEDVPDTHVVTLLLPGGESIEAVGTYSGIRERGLFNKFKKKYRKKFRKKYTKRYRKKLRRNPRLAKRLRSNPNLARQRAKQEAQKNVRKEVRKIPKHVQEESANEARILKCKALVTALKAGKSVSHAMKPILSAVQSQSKALENQIKRDPHLITRMQNKGEKSLKNYEQFIPEMRRIVASMNTPFNQSKLAAFASADNICAGKLASLDAQLKKLGLAPRFAQVRSRAATQPGSQRSQFFVSFGVIEFTATVVKGITGGISYVTNFNGQGGWFWSLGNEWGAGLGFGMSAGFYPKVSFDSFTGEGKSVRAGAVVGIALEFDENWKFQGFAVGPAAKIEGGYATTNTKRF